MVLPWWHHTNGHAGHWPLDRRTCGSASDRMAGEQDCPAPAQLRRHLPGVPPQEGTPVLRVIAREGTMMNIGRVGIWTFALDMQPAARAQEAAAEIEQLGYGAIWVPEALGREAFTNSARLL